VKSSPAPRLGVKSVYIIHDKTDYGQGVAEFFRQQAEKNGITVAGFEGTEEQANFESILTPILAANPDLIYFGGIYEPGRTHSSARPATAASPP
jgi:branched-chain amino acid transport system substrate-binding protein